MEENNLNHYYKNGLLIGTVSCSFKCLHEQNLPITICQNSHIAILPTIEEDIDFIIKKYNNNKLQECVIFAGLEPFDQFQEIYKFIEIFRNSRNDDIVIYTGYEEKELKDIILKLKKYSNIIIKFGRFIKNSEKIFDNVLKVSLASKNQYAIKIS